MYGDICLCENSFLVMCIRLLGDEPQPSLPLSFHHVLFYCRYGVLDCKHWSIIRDIFSLHQVQFNFEWIPLFTYALSPFCWSCSGRHAHYFGVSFVMVSLLYDFWYVAACNAVIYIYQVEISLFIKIMYSISPKNLILSLYGGKLMNLSTIRNRKVYGSDWIDFIC